jgi:hypothetical protein
LEALSTQVLGTYWDNSYPDTLFEAVAQAVVEFKHDKTAAEPPVLETEVTVSILRKPVEHYIRLKKVRALAQPSNRGGPAELLRRRESGRCYKPQLYEA